MPHGIAWLLPLLVCLAVLRPLAAGASEVQSTRATLGEFEVFVIADSYRDLDAGLFLAANPEQAAQPAIAFAFDLDPAAAVWPRQGINLSGAMAETWAKMTGFQTEQIKIGAWGRWASASGP